MTTCPHAHDVGAHLLGALPDDERAAFEAHLPGCASCRAELDDLADLPELLALADPPDAVEAPPPAILVGALARRRRRRTVVRAGALAAVVAAFVAGIAVSTLVGSSTPSVARTVALASVGDAPVRGDAQLTGVAWGTRLRVDCIARGGAPPPSDAPPTTYVLVLRGDDGAEQQVARWSPPPGQDVRIDASTDLPPSGVAGLEVRTTTGRVVMRG